MTHHPSIGTVRSTLREPRKFPAEQKIAWRSRNTVNAKDIQK
jgi:hypothetical protein